MGRSAVARRGVRGDDDCNRCPTTQGGQLSESPPVKAKPIEEVFATFLEAASTAHDLTGVNVAAGIAREDLLGIDTTNL
jgi:hypothetical protein